MFYIISKLIIFLQMYYQGEETSEFTNTLGEKIKVQICDTQEDTSDLLCRVLDGRKVAADLLAKAVHAPFPSRTDPGNSIGNISMNPYMCKSIVEDLAVVPGDEKKQFSADDLAIWIDPIGEYLLN